MPTVQGVTYSEAWAEAVTIAPIDKVILMTIELTHPLFDEPARAVIDRVDFRATLEYDAPNNPGEEVLFIASPVEVTLPDENLDPSAPSITISVGDVGHVVSPYLELASSSLIPAEIILREYVSSDPSGPARVPVIRMTVTGATVTESGVTIQASYVDPANRGFPARSYTSKEYPGLSSR